MKASSFLKLDKNDVVLMDDKDYRVIDIDRRMGRVQLRQIVYFIDSFDTRDDEYDTYDECMDALNGKRYDDIDCDLVSSDIIERLTGKSFWINYRDIE